MTTATSLRRALSAFNCSTRRWAPISSPTPRLSLPPSSSGTDGLSTQQRLSLVSWNVDAFNSRPVARASRILGHILLAGPSPPDIVFLQEVTRDARAALLDDARVRAAFLATDAEDDTSFEGVPFATMTLLSRARFAESHGIEAREEDVGLGRVSRVALPSKYGRDALCVDILAPSAVVPGTVLRLVNVHLDSLGDALPYRAQQLEILADALREPGCRSGIIAGDFNAISREDDGLVDGNGLVDGWVALHGSQGPDGATWGVGVERHDGLGPGRLDKVAMMDVKVEGMEVLRPGLIEVPRPGEEPLEIPWSDHCGLRCTFVV